MAKNENKDFYDKNKPRSVQDVVDSVKDKAKDVQNSVDEAVVNEPVEDLRTGLDKAKRFAWTYQEEIFVTTILLGSVWLNRRILRMELKNIPAIHNHYPAVMGDVVDEVLEAVEEVI